MLINKDKNIFLYSLLKIKKIKKNKNGPKTIIKK